MAHHDRDGHRERHHRDGDRERRHHGRHQAPANALPYGGMQSAAQHAYSQEHKHKKNEHIAELGALGAAAFAMHEKHQAKKDPAHASRHKKEESVAAAVAVGLGAYAVHEHHLASKDHKLQASHGHHKGHRHGLFK